MSCCIENLCRKTDVEPFLRVLPAYQYYSTRLLLLSLFCSWNHFLILELGIAFPNQLNSRSFPCEFSTRLLRESGISFVYQSFHFSSSGRTLLSLVFSGVSNVFRFLKSYPLMTSLSVAEVNVYYQVQTWLYADLHC